MRNPLTPAGIEPATFRFVAQHLNHRATAEVKVYALKMTDHNVSVFIKQNRKMCVRQTHAHSCCSPLDILRDGACLRDSL